MTSPNISSSPEHDFANPDVVGGRKDRTSAEEQSAEEQSAMSESLEASNSLTPEKQSNTTHPRPWKTRLLQLKRSGGMISGVVGNHFGRPAGQQVGQARPWKTTLFRFGPLSGIFSMLLALSCMIASLGILAGSNHQPTPSWSVPPSTYLAIFTAIANLSMRYAAIQGVVITWWYRSLRGSTLAKLHWDWHAGTTLRGALTAGRRTGLLGLACIFSTVVVIDGPLLQRSTTVIPTKVIDHAVPLKVSLTPELPHGLGGGWSHVSALQGAPYGWAFNDTFPTPNGTASNYVFAEAGVKANLGEEKELIEDLPLTGIVQGCDGICTFNLFAPALFATSCVTHRGPLGYDYEINLGAVFRELSTPPMDHDAFLIAPNLVLGEKESINLVTQYSSAVNCKGTWTRTICNLEAGIGEYNATVSKDGSVTLDSKSLTRPKFFAFANNTYVDRSLRSSSSSKHDATLAYVVEHFFEGFAALEFYASGDTGLAEFVLGAPIFDAYLSPVQNPGKCASYDDPHDDMMQELNKRMVYAGAAATRSWPLDVLRSKIDPGLSIASTVTGYLQAQTVFHTNYWYFVGAILVELFCIALVAPTYYGFWKLGRPVSLSPLETAKALESPFFATYNSNSSGRDLAQAVGNTSVRYGETTGNEEGRRTRLGFGDSSKVVFPRTNANFDV